MYPWQFSTKPFCCGYVMEIFSVFVQSFTLWSIIELHPSTFPKDFDLPFLLLRVNYSFQIWVTVTVTGLLKFWIFFVVMVLFSNFIHSFSLWSLLQVNHSSFSHNFDRNSSLSLWVIFSNFFYSFTLWRPLVNKLRPFFQNFGWFFSLRYDIILKLHLPFTALRCCPQTIFIVCPREAYSRCTHELSHEILSFFCHSFTVAFLWNFI